MPREKILTPQQRERVRELPAYSLHLDLVRGLAALVVFAGHLRVVITGHTGAISTPGADPISFHPANATGLGHSSVIVFYVLSGYLVGGSVLRDLNRKAFSWAGYVIRRLSRLWTVLLPCLLIGAAADYATWRFFSKTTVFAFGAFTGDLHGLPQAAEFLDYLFFLQDVDRIAAPSYGTNIALLTLSAEFWYYVFFPLLVVGFISVSLRRMSRVCFILLAGVLLWFSGWSIAQYFPLWLCGFAAYLAPARIPSRLQTGAILVLTAQFCFVLYLFRAHGVNALAADTAIAASFTLLLYALLHRTHPAAKSLYSRFAHSISFPSYTLYAAHVPACILFAALFEAEAPSVFRHTLAASTLIALLVLLYAGALYYLFERHTDRVRRFFEGIFVQTRGISGDRIRAGPVSRSAASQVGS